MGPTSQKPEEKDGGRAKFVDICYFVGKRGGVGGLFCSTSKEQLYLLFG